ncbi:MAG: hypothetical protein JWN38_142 [Candidatus Saccharibacteria bacterium]|nr:hypothetical protein [Candidatus Saccharibacteria bacterium]
MVSKKSVEQQLKRIHFGTQIWGRAEISELPNILMPNEEIFECVNGMYEGGFALLCATNMRLLLIDKKPLKYLTVEDLRFDMINEIDYSHRMLGAKINVSTGSKNLKFTSYNQQRLRKLIGHIQHRMADIKNQQSVSADTQQQHLERINEQLQAYLLAQHRHQEALQAQLSKSADAVKTDKAPAMERPDPELADYLYAQSLLRQHTAGTPSEAEQASAAQVAPVTAPEPSPEAATQPAAAPTPRTDDLIAAGRAEIFGHQPVAPAPATSSYARSLLATKDYVTHIGAIEINPLRIAYAKLPLALRNRKFGRPSFHPHGQSTMPSVPPVNPVPAR